MPRQCSRPLFNVYPQVFRAADLRIAIALLLCLAASLCFSSCRPASPDGLEVFREAYKGVCTNQARTTALSLPPCSGSQREGPIAIDAQKRNRAKSSLLDAVSERPGAAAENALGQFYLVERDLDRAIEHLQRAVELEAGSARYHSDLAAALLEKGKADIALPESSGGEALSGRAVEEFGGSLEQIEAALRLDSSLPEALFNRALCCQHLSLWNEARLDWIAFLERDSTTPWADLAKRNIVSAQGRQMAKLVPGDDLFQRFARACQTGDDPAAFQALSQAGSATGNSTVDQLIDSILVHSSGMQNAADGEALKMLTYAARIEQLKTHDAYLSDISRYYAQTNATQRGAVADARRAMSNAYALAQRSDLNNAAVGYDKARRAFLAAADRPDALLAEFEAAHCYTIQPNTKKALPLLQEVRRACEINGYQELLARCLYDLSNIYTDYFEYSAAVDYSLQSEKLFRSIGDTGKIVRSQNQLAEEYHELSDNRTSLAYVQRVLITAADTELDRQQLWQLHALLAFNFAALGLDLAAMDCWKEAANDAVLYSRPLITATTYQHLGTQYAKVKLYDQAIASAQAASDIGARMGNEPNGLNILAKSLLVLGNIFRQQGDQAKSIRFYDRSSEVYKRLALRVNDYPVHKGKLLAYLALGDDRAAAAELHAALSLVERYRSTIRDLSKREVFFDAEQDIYDLAIKFEYSPKHDVKKAFDRSEESRARSFLDLLASGGRVESREIGPDLRFSGIAHPDDFTHIQKGLPDRAEIVQYAALSDGIIIWVITKAGIECRTSPIPLGDLSDKVTRYLKLLSTRDSAAAGQLKGLAGELYRLLISPIEPLIDTDKQICIVPDKILNYLPFGSLVSPATGNYLIETCKLLYSPSATLFERCSRMAARKSGSRTESLLAVANPAFDHDEFPLLGDLPDAEREVEGVKCGYLRPLLLTGNQCDKATVLNELGKSDVVEFATHSMIDGFSPLRSKLVVAAGPALLPRKPGDSAIESTDIYPRKLGRTRLVVLSSCESAVGRTYRGEGAMSLARPFISAGAPLVVASLWKVDSAATANLMIAFHRYRTKGGLTSVDALRRAQLDMIRGQDEGHQNPFCWAAFAAYGGYAGF
jgi:CHAT domain-containing protein/tetratricopeptide (TPR) repeat protein